MSSQKYIRIIDLTLAIIFLFLLIPLIILIITLLFLRFNFNIFFISQRVGKNNNSFKMLKFRSFESSHIELNDKNSKPVFIGRIIRRLSLDEIPQLFNVLMGHMSIVGPRPLPNQIENKIDIKTRHLIRSVLPGITGLSQIKYNGRKRTLNHKIKYDIIYVKNISVKLYVYILIKTIPAIINRFLYNKKGVSN